MLKNYLQMPPYLFGRLLRHFLISASREVVAAHRSDSKQCVGRRASTLPWTGAIPVEGWRLLGAALGFAAIMASSATAANGTTAAQMAVPTASFTTSSQNDLLAKFVDEASRRFDIPATWIHAVMQVESNGNPIAVSSKGAMGLMQIMPGTWADLRARHQLGADPFDPHDNILAGAAYLRELYKRFGEGGFLAAYNAGPTGFENYLAGLRPLRAETIDYLAKLQRLLPALRLGGRMNAIVSVTAWRQATLFPTPSTAAPSPLKSSPYHSPTTNSSPASFALTPQSSGMFVPILTPPQ